MKNGTKPIIFIYCPEMYMKRYIGEFKNVLQDYGHAFDVYYIPDQKKAEQVFYTKEFPEIFPFVAIVDPTKRIDIGETSKTYSSKYREMVFFNKIEQDFEKLIEKFMDGEADLFFQSKRRNHDTLVKKICSSNFKQEVLDNPDVTQCIIEVFKHDCPSCAFNGKVFNVFSRKLQKHGYDDKLKLFRLSIDNKVPYLGNFGYSPMYLLV